MWDEFDSDIYFNDYTHLSKKGEEFLTDLIIPEIDKILSLKNEIYEINESLEYTVPGF